jgi:hypothetical protein
MSAYVYPYLSAHQTRNVEPTAWQMELASALESIFGKGAHTLDELVAGLNASRVRPAAGGAWTSENYTALMAELGTPQGRVS